MKVQPPDIFQIDSVLITNIMVHFQTFEEDLDSLVILNNTAVTHSPLDL